MSNYSTTCLANRYFGKINNKTKRSDKGFLILEKVMKKEYNKSAYKVNEKEFFKMKTQELNLKQFVMLSEKELQEISGGGGWGSAFAGWLGGIGVKSGQTAQQVVNQLNVVTGFHAYNHNPYGSGGTPND